ncbi:MAG: diacylglycerol kinase family protein [Nocardioides sp.]
MIERPRAYKLTWAIGFLAAFLLLAALVSVYDRSSLGPVDRWARAAEDWADGYPMLVTGLRWVETLFGTAAMTAYTLALAAMLLWRKHRRTAAYVVGVMLSTSLLTTLVKVTVGRARPEWQDPIGLLESRSFPSGHASAITAFAGILIMLAVMFLRRSALRRLAYAAATLLALVVIADRLLLGRHYPSDVLAGALLGLTVMFAGLVVYDPIPRVHGPTAAPVVDSVPTRRQLAVILNPIKIEDPSAFRTTVSSMAADAGWRHPRWHYTTVEDPGGGMAAQAAADGADLVIVCGGDGTVREVCAELAGTGIPVGIIPAGTGNLLARNLAIPLYLRSALEVALSGQDKAIDLVSVTGDGLDDTHFLVMAGMGMDAAIMEGVNEDIKKKVGWIAYVFSGIKSMMSPAVKLEISLDGGEFTPHRARTVVVGNVGFLQAGLPLLPDAAIDDGRLDVVLIHPRTFFSWVPLAARILARARHTDESLDRMTGGSVVVRASVDTPRQLDGDSIGSGRELRMECIHGRLLVRVPRGKGVAPISSTEALPSSSG